MFLSSTTVLHFTRTSASIAEIAGSSGHAKKKEKQLPWTPETSAQALSQLTKGYSLKKCRVVLGDDIVYVVRTSIPTEITTTKQRTSVAEIVAQEIPEILSSHQWDFAFEQASAQQDSSQQPIIIFAPVVSVYTAISDSLVTLGATVFAVEPEEIARTRHQDPMIGIALKEDSKGADRHSLNMPLLPSQSSEVTSEQQQSEVSLRWVVLLAFGCGLLALGVVAGVAARYSLLPI